jgi:hypothetical protein
MSKPTEHSADPSEGSLLEFCERQLLYLFGEAIILADRNFSISTRVWHSSGNPLGIRDPFARAFLFVGQQQRASLRQPPGAAEDQRRKGTIAALQPRGAVLRHDNSNLAPATSPSCIQQASGRTFAGPWGWRPAPMPRELRIARCDVPFATIRRQELRTQYCVHFLRWSSVAPVGLPIAAADDA